MATHMRSGCLMASLEAYRVFVARAHFSQLEDDRAEASCADLCRLWPGKALKALDVFACFLGSDQLSDFRRCRPRSCRLQQAASARRATTTLRCQAQCPLQLPYRVAALGYRGMDIFFGEGFANTHVHRRIPLAYLVRISLPCRVKRREYTQPP